MADCVKSGRKEKFTILYNSMITDRRLSLKAKGLFAVMMSRPDDWEFSVSGLAVFAGVGKDTIRSTLAELEKVGYLIRAQAHDSGGRFLGNIYVLQDTAPPLSGNTDDGESRQRESTSSENPTQQKKDYNKEKTNNTPIPPEGATRKGSRKKADKTIPDWKPERFEAFWAYYREHARGEDRQGAVRAWDKLKPDDTEISAMARALRWQTASEDWLRGVGIPYAKTWLNNRRWTDVPVPSRSPDLPDRPPESWEDRFGWK